MCRPSLSHTNTYKTWWILSKNPGRSFSFTALARSKEVTAATRACGPLTQSRTSAKSLQHMAKVQLRSHLHHRVPRMSLAQT